MSLISLQFQRFSCEHQWNLSAPDLISDEQSLYVILSWLLLLTTDVFLNMRNTSVVNNCNHDRITYRDCSSDMRSGADKMKYCHYLLMTHISLRDSNKSQFFPWDEPFSRTTYQIKTIYWRVSCSTTYLLYLPTDHWMNHYKFLYVVRLWVCRHKPTGMQEDS